MSPGEVLDIGREAMWVLVLASMPAMLTALFVGTVIGLLQALTQIQESTLVFVPKILAVFICLVVAMPFMGATIYGLTEMIFARIAQP